MTLYLTHQMRNVAHWFIPEVLLSIRNGERHVQGPDIFDGHDVGDGGISWFIGMIQPDVGSDVFVLHVVEMFTNIAFQFVQRLITKHYMKQINYKNVPWKLPKFDTMYIPARPIMFEEYHFSWNFKSSWRTSIPLDLGMSFRV